MATLTPDLRAQRARLAAFTRWSKNDPVEGTKAAREAFRAQFERDVDPDGVLDPAERQRRAECARKAFYARLAFKSARARAARRGDAA